jgi:GTP-binding protein
VVIEVPPGTVVKDEETGEILGDLVRVGQEALVAPGGRGGKGNRRFATPTNRAPRYAQPGLPGRERKIRLILKHLAQVGLIGLPNAGKSTLLSRLTTAEPRIAEYPFTTLTPNLGAISFDDGEYLTVADIPGLIKGAKEGKGLGHRFLKHIERTALLLHVVDMTEPAEGRGPLDDFAAIEEELSGYDPGLLEKERLVLLNKMDAWEEGRHRDPEELRTILEGKGFRVFLVSALTGEGLDRVLRALHEKARTRAEEG